MRYYIATKLENHQAHNTLRDQLTELGHEITYDWTHHGPVYGEGLKRCREVAEAETDGVLEADVVIVLWPGGRGTHVEMGIAIGAASMDASTYIYFVSDIEDHHQATTETCAFYHHPFVERFRSIEELIDTIKQRHE